jgi:homoserine dehydrogenase
VSVDDFDKINKDDFEWIEEWHNGLQYSWLVAIVHAEKLIKSNWWREPGVSLIVYPESIVDNVDYKNISKRSLQLAGVV